MRWLGACSIVVSLLGAAAAAVLCFTALMAAGYETMNQQQRVRGLFAGGAVVPDKMKALIKSNTGLVIPLTGGIDRVGSPTDDWTAVANSYFRADSSSSYSLVSAWAAGGLALFLSLMLLVNGVILCIMPRPVLKNPPSVTRGPVTSA